MQSANQQIVRKTIMNKILFLNATFILVFLPIFATLTFAEELNPIQLLKPQFDKGRPLMQVLKDRSSSRSFSKEKLPLQVISDMLWARIGKPSVEPLCAALKDYSAVTRRNAAIALGQIKDTSAVEPLIATLKDEDLIVRRNAATAVGQIKDARAAEPLIAVLKDKDAIVRTNAVTALREIGKPAVEALIVNILD